MMDDTESPVMEPRPVYATLVTMALDKVDELAHRVGWLEAELAATDEGHERMHTYLEAFGTSQGGWDCDCV